MEGRFTIRVGALIYNISTHKILLLQRSKNCRYDPLGWEMPAGRMQQFEDPLDSLKREVKEEAGIFDLEIIKPLRVFHFFRKEKTAEDEIVGIIFYCKTTQKEVVISNEHENYQWVSIDEALMLVTHEGVKEDIISLKNNLN